MLKFFGTLLLASVLILTTTGCVGTNNTTSQSINQNSQINSLNEQNNYLAKPTGKYGVGFQDFHFQDNNRCPDVFFKVGVNESDFSPENNKHCREIMVRAYYPSSTPIEVGSPYYYPQILYTENFFKKIVAYITPQTKLDFTNFEITKSYALNNANLIQNKFPVIIFSPGSQNSVQDYENTITDLVSHGYVIIGVNSIFLSGYTELPNHHIVEFSGQDSATFKQRSLDIEYIYNQINYINSKLSNIIDTNKIGMMGHSDGANGIAQVLSTTSQYKAGAAIAMDTDVKPNYESFEMPFLHMLSGTRYWTGKYGAPSGRIDYTPQYLLAKNNYLVGITPTIDELINPAQHGPMYTTHGSFTNEETLQYLDVYQTMQPIYDALNKIIFDGNNIGPEWGTGNGFKVTNSINTYIRAFFDNYLKGEYNPLFNNTSDCNALTDDTIAVCGPTIFPLKIK
jgi:hypothetical protein